ncbi:YggS family pyridoxal phosphate-dependent enzyme [Sediminicurvatus halobius]|uniref:Pyridoxal phosphate homeostasis protein n=1 Tax=Sediminicurvatus halobius TaxID=2182432 RepID=A0A2U2MYT8_9GAMM|nr:YggS family pyridoxal phosphate-dependent enzyme [Spiribacter halobius]PWG61978.1 YggS family pyridoxal phosphate-dependent enzyme [Spiribacter halobius]UEX78384.1 YggS family pyridoxal phosphate-dependent enzyme [Spiribacter halobius]
MNAIAARLDAVRERIRQAETRFGREPGSVALLAISKRHPPEALREALAAGQHAFGENYLQEALDKREALAGYPVEWHFVGPLQSNKTKPAAECFDWIHTLDRPKIARRLSEQRPEDRPPLNCCIQVNVSGEASKSGVTPADVEALAETVAALPGLRLRGLMTLPAPAAGLEAQRQPLRALRECLEALNARGYGLDTLSMGMSDDLEAAVAEGATIVRIGTAVFGPRPPG